ncbi:hypothetical protein DB31_8018 [Hyalangium minutum]|uniref:Uncharacterized protein n=1 Tax=Hyalangium minutum TaxID=394096 RepID=A0A085WIM2_9BACT|nr:hypothetical protein DB31_8018 [Hyalangium minutum]
MSPRQARNAAEHDSANDCLQELPGERGQSVAPLRGLMGERLEQACTSPKH